MNEENFEGLMRSLKEARVHARGKSTPGLKVNLRCRVSRTKRSHISSASPSAFKKREKSPG